MGYLGYNSKPNVALATVQYEGVLSGPGTFARYVESCNENLDLTILSRDISEPDPQHRRVEFASLEGWPGGQFVRSYVYHQAVSAAHEFRQFDLVWYNTSPKTGFFSAVTNFDVPVVLMINDYNNAISRYPFGSRGLFGVKQSVVRPIWRIFEKWALHACDAVVVNSRFMKRIIREWYGLSEEKLFLLYKAVDADFFTFKSSISFELPLNVLFIKHDYIRGGLEELVAALSQLSVQTELTIAGPGRHKIADIREIVQTRNYQGNVNFLGRVDRERVRDLFQSHDLFCVPSRAEALGVVFLEALASGTPAVGTRIGGIPEVLDEGKAGWMASPRDVNSLRRTLEEVVRNAESRKERVRHGRDYVEQFSVDRMVRRMRRIVQEILTQETGSAA